MNVEHDKLIQSYLQSSEELDAMSNKAQDTITAAHAVLLDLDHYLELGDLSDEDTNALISYRELILAERRSAKNLRRVIDSILPRQTGRTTRDRYEDSIRKLGDRVYHHRKVTCDDVLNKVRNINGLNVNILGDL